MENLIEKIIDLEKEAQVVMADADIQKQNINADIEKEVKNIEKKLYDKMQNKINEIKKMEDDTAISRTGEIEKNTQESLLRLRSLYQKNGKQWEDMLFERLFRD